jgi:hypothetical protein
LISEGRKRKRATSNKIGGKAKEAKKQPARGKTNDTKNNIKRDIFPKRIIREISMAAEALSVSLEFEIC